MSACSAASERTAVNHADPFVRVALTLGLAALGSALLLLLALVVLRQWQVRHAAHEQRLIERWQPLLAAALDNAPSDLPALAQRDHRVLLPLWIRTQEALRGPAREQLNTFARRMGLDKTARRWIQQRSTAPRMLALAAVGLLGERGVEPQVRAMVDSHAPWMALAAAQAWLRMHPAAALPHVLQRAGQRGDWATTRVAAMLREVDRIELSTALGAALAAAPSSAARLLRVAALAQAPLTHHATVLVCRSDPEALAAALTLVQQPWEAPLVRRHCQHPHWLVRMEAARALGRVGASEDLPALTTALGDGHWWVRYRAAQTLIRAPWLDPAALQRISAEHPDRFAQDMLQHAQAETAKTLRTA